jgi:hypothetical protein
MSARRKTPTVDENKRTAVFDKNKHGRGDGAEYPEVDPTVVDGPLAQALREDPGSITGPTTIHDKPRSPTGPTVVDRPGAPTVLGKSMSSAPQASQRAADPSAANPQRTRQPAPTQQGVGQSGAKRDATGPAPAIGKASGPVQAISMKDQPMQAISMKDATGPLQAISMKTPGQGATAAAAPNATPMLPRPKLRAMAEVASEVVPPNQQNLGHVAPPYDPEAARARQVREYVIWGCVAVILASVIALVVWFVAR